MERQRSELPETVSGNCDSLLRVRTPSRLFEYRHTPRRCHDAIPNRIDGRPRQPDHHLSFRSHKDACCPIWPWCVQRHVGCRPKDGETRRLAVRHDQLALMSSGMYKGMFASMLGIIPYSGVELMVYSYLTVRIRSLLNSRIASCRRASTRV